MSPLRQPSPLPDDESAPETMRSGELEAVLAALAAAEDTDGAACWLRPHGGAVGRVAPMLPPPPDDGPASIERSGLMRVAARRARPAVEPVEWLSDDVLIDEEDEAPGRPGLFIEIIAPAPSTDATPSLEVAASTTPHPSIDVDLSDLDARDLASPGGNTSPTERSVALLGEVPPTLRSA